MTHYGSAKPPINRAASERNNFRRHPHLPNRLRKRLKQVSRSFYLTLRILPHAVRSQIGLAYLLARASDTIADTTLLPRPMRLSHLRAFQNALEAIDPALLPRITWANPAAASAEENLLTEMPELIAALGQFPPQDIRRIQGVLRHISDGQADDLQRFHSASSDTNAPRIVSLRTEGELDEYTYKIAGAVGEFWTQMTYAHLFQPDEVELIPLLAKGIAFGKGLQRVNILRDLPSDLQSGRCYIPSESLTEIGLTPEDLLSSGHEKVFRPLYDRHLAEAQSQLEAGWAYTHTLPTRHFRLRLACAWPLLFGFRTLALLRQSPALGRNTPIKIPRTEVYYWMAASLARLPSRRLLHPLARKASQGSMPCT